MRSALLFGVLLCLIRYSFSQNIVIKVTGRIKRTDGTVVKVGTKLSDNELLLFSSKQDALRIMIPGKGTFVFSPGSKAQKKDNGWLELLSGNIKIQSSTASLSGRGQEYEMLPEAITSKSSVNPKVVISSSGPNKYLFKASVYDLADGSKFILQIVQDGNTVIHPLRTSKDTLLLYLSDFQVEESKSSKPVNYTIGFYNKSKNTTTEVAGIEPYFDVAGEMENMIRVLITENKNSTIAEQRELCYGEIYRALGKPSDLLFDKIFPGIQKEDANKLILESNYFTGLREDIVLYQQVPKISANLMRDQVDLPSQFSLQQYTPPVQSQGKYGTCVAWSSAYAARSIAWAVRNNYNNIDDRASIIKYSFSPQYLFLNIRSDKDPGCENGAGMVTALIFMKESGDIFWDGVPYNCSASYSDADRSEAQHYKIKDFQRLCNWFAVSDTAILDMKRALAEKKPLVFGMHMPESFKDVDPSSGIWYPSSKDYTSAKKAKSFPNQFYSGHAMCIVGYNDAVNGGSFQIMNSWGTACGKDGFFWISYEDIKTFASQVFALKDIETSVNEWKDKASPVIAKYILEGSMTFIKGEKGPSGKLTFTTGMNVEKKIVDSKGKEVTGDAASHSDTTYAVFHFTGQYPTGTKYKMKYFTHRSCYVYVFGKDDASVYSLFPNSNENESPLIDFMDAGVLLPSPGKSFTLTGSAGKEKMCVLISKAPVEIDRLLQSLKISDSLYKGIQNFLENRLIELKDKDFSGTGMHFSREVTESEVIGLFIEMDHS